MPFTSILCFGVDNEHRLILESEGDAGIPTIGYLITRSKTLRQILESVLGEGILSFSDFRAVHKPIHMHVC